MIHLDLLEIPINVVGAYFAKFANIRQLFDVKAMLQYQPDFTSKEKVTHTERRGGQSAVNRSEKKVKNVLN